MLSFLSIQKLFFPLYTSSEIIISSGLNQFDICQQNLNLWNFLKTSFCFLYILINLLLIYLLINKLEKYSTHFNYQKNINNISKNNINFQKNNKKINLLIGKEINSQKNIIIPELGLYQNFLITGTIGTGKTSSAMYPFTEQLIKYNSLNKNNKIPILILDVKCNYFNYIKKVLNKYNLKNDLIEIGLNSKIKYNPLHKPYLKPAVLANRLKTVLLLFSENNSESFWLDKIEQILTEAIKLCRLYNNGYVTFKEIHNLITDHDYYSEKINTLRNKFLKHKFNSDQSYDLLSALNFFEKEFYSLDSRTFNILKSEITRITSCFVSDSDVLKTFCPEKSKNNFPGFQSIIESGKIVILNMNINEYKNLSKIIATYLKLDFQTEVLRRLAANSTNIHPVAFISDEYSEYVSATDANFFSQSRESKCINIVSTQSYTSLLNALNNKYSVEVIVQNLVNKLWFRSDDMFTIEDAQKQLRKNRCRKNFKNHIRKCKGDILQLYYAFITIKKFQYFRKYKYLYSTRL